MERYSMGRKSTGSHPGGLWPRPGPVPREIPGLLLGLPLALEHPHQTWSQHVPRGPRFAASPGHCPHPTSGHHLCARLLRRLLPCCRHSVCLGQMCFKLLSEHLTEMKIWYFCDVYCFTFSCRLLLVAHPRSDHRSSFSAPTFLLCVSAVASFWI